MTTTQQAPIGIHLLGIPEKDQAVIQRVIHFGATQGKPYQLASSPAQASILIGQDNHPIPSLPHPVITIRIGELGTACDILLQRPLLVTRVMRALDDAVQLLKQTTSAPQPTATTETANTTGFIIPHTQAEGQQNSITETVPSPEVQEETQTAPPTQSTSVTETQHDNPAQATVTSEPPQAPPKPFRYTALVVDDSAAIRKQLELELRDAQINADFAETGEEALAKTAQNHYDLIFLDIVLPGIDGYEVCKQMRLHKTMKKTPIIMLSGKTSPLDEVKGVLAGATTYLTKPVKHEQFQQTLQRVSKWLSNFAAA